MPFPHLALTKLPSLLDLKVEKGATRGRFQRAKRVVRGEEFKPDSRPSRSLPATLLTSLGEVELKKL